MRGCQRSEAVIDETRGENLDWEMLLPIAVDKNSKPINFLDPIVGDGDAADGGAVSVKEDVTTQVLPEA